MVKLSIQVFVFTLGLGLGAEVIGQFPEFTATRPYDGGIINLQLAVGNSASIPISRIELTATEGTLQGTDEATPFESLLLNSPQNWVAVAPTAPVELQRWPRLTLENVSASFDSVITGVLTDADSNTTTFNVERNRPRYTHLVIGRFDPIDGGHISVESIEPVAMRSLEVFAETGKLVAGGSAFPFEEIDVESTSNFWRASSNSNVILDGEATLDVEVSPNSKLSGRFNNGEYTTRFDFRYDFPGFHVPADYLSCSVSCLALFVPEGGGQVLVVPLGPDPYPFNVQSSRATFPDTGRAVLSSVDGQPYPPEFGFFDLAPGPIDRPIASNLFADSTNFSLWNDCPGGACEQIWRAFEYSVPEPGSNNLLTTAIIIILGSRQLRRSRRETRRY